MQKMKSWKSGKILKKHIMIMNSQQFKNTLCDWCYYKPICPVFNDDAPNTEELRSINEAINELQEEVEALDMFKDDNDIPKESPIGSKDRIEIQNKLTELENQKNDIQSEIEKLLGK
jgi:hypothetical protein